MQSQDAENKIQKRMMILCRKPRHITTVSAAKRVVEQRNVKLADQVGYSRNFENCSSDQTIIKYITDKILLKELLTDY